MKLFLLRHAKAKSDIHFLKDFDRELSKKGKKQATSMQVFLKDNFVFKNLYVFCSKAKRTRQTLALIKNSLGEYKVNYEQVLYLAEQEKLLSYIEQIKDADTVLMVGHNNGLSDLASYLLGYSIQLPTCGLLVLSFELNNWQEVFSETASLETHYFPQILD